MLGGGACSFKPMNVSGSCRDDNLDLFGWARSNGWTVMEDKASFDALNGGEDVELPYIGLFTEGKLGQSSHHALYPRLIPSLQTAT